MFTGNYKNGVVDVWFYIIVILISFFPAIVSSGMDIYRFSYFMY